MTIVFLACAPESICPVYENIVQLDAGSPLWTDASNTPYRIMNYVSPPQTSAQIDADAATFGWVNTPTSGAASSTAVSYIMYDDTETLGPEILKGWGLNPPPSLDP